MLITVSTLVSGFLRNSVTTPQVLTNYMFDLPKWITIILPFSCLSASLFCLENLRSKNELVAFYAAGFSYKHIISLITQITLFIALTNFVMAGYVVPFFLDLKIQWLQKSGANFKSNQFSSVGHSLKAGGKIWFKKDPYYFSFLAFDKEKLELVDITIYKLNKKNKFEQIIKAKKAIFVEGENWRLQTANSINQLHVDDFASSSPSDEMIISLGQKPDDLDKIEAEVSTLNPLELARFIKQVSRSDINTSNYEIQLFEKFAKPLLCILFALLPVLGFSSANRRNAHFGRIAGFALVFCILYWLAQSTLQAMGQNNKIPSMVAVFLIPVLFLFATVLGFRKKAKLI